MQKSALKVKYVHTKSSEIYFIFRTGKICKKVLRQCKTQSA